MTNSYININGISYYADVSSFKFDIEFDVNSTTLIGTGDSTPKNYIYDSGFVSPKVSVTFIFDPELYYEHKQLREWAYNRESLYITSNSETLWNGFGTTKHWWILDSYSESITGNDFYKVSVSFMPVGDLHRLSNNDDESQANVDIQQMFGTQLQSLYDDVGVLGWGQMINGSMRLDKRFIVVKRILKNLGYLNETNLSGSFTDPMVHAIIDFKTIFHLYFDKIDGILDRPLIQQLKNYIYYL
jgi:hypothetical protein